MRNQHLLEQQQMLREMLEMARRKLSEPRIRSDFSD
jgi:hypothetical protein